MLECIVIAIKISVVGFVYADILTGPGMVFEDLDSYLEAKLKRWLYKPLIGCSRCAAGQASIWLYPLLVDEYSPLNHLFTVCLTVLFVVFLEKIVYENQ